MPGERTKGLHVENLDVSYGRARVLFDVSLEVQLGEVVVIVGRNGAGKTTLFRTIAGFLKPSNGSITFKDRPIAGLPPYEVARLGVKYIPQDKSVFSDLKVRENLELSSYATKDYDWDSVLEYFPQLKTLLERKAGTLSGGERQMLMVARALLGQPELLLMDEPTEGLAPSLAADLGEALKKIRQKSTLLIIEQNLPLAADIADRVYCMKEGKIINETIDQEEIKSIAFERYL